MNTLYRAAWPLALVALMILSACSTDISQRQPENKDEGKAPNASPVSSPASAPAPAGGTQKAAQPGDGLEVAVFAGGCFWCMEPPFEKLDGVKDAISGYTGGPEKGPTYKEVSRGKTGHTEAVWVIFDPKKVSYETILKTYWKSFDPTDAGGQFADRGPHYRPGIFVFNADQRTKAEASKAELAKNGPFKKPIVVPIEDAGDFWIAEDYHQNFYKTNPSHYKRYSKGSGRVGFIREHWGDQAP
mgnify:CR=1 FL=1